MKWLVIIWTFYLMALSAVPCSDSVSRYTAGSNTANQASNTAHSHANDNEDACTPFCQCACCSVSIAMPNFSIPNFPSSLIVHSADIDVALREFYLASDFYGNIWQPPRINA